MKVSEKVNCKDYPCTDVRHECYIVPDIELKPEEVSIIMISEAAPVDSADYYYASDDAFFAQTTVQAFKDAGADVSSFQDILNLGVYCTSAVKCGKTGYGIKTDTVKQCSHILEKELDLFPSVKVYMLMGDIAIKAINDIARRAGEKRVIPAGSTYKIRGQEYRYRDIRAFPSYLQAGPSFFIEKSKRKMIAEDIATALDYIKR
ncbi:MAG: uracil-DNA glycosylase [Dehalococcoidales bacterium]|nr:MAG: uracil-DNA glycosylase [Dehalococcoidales bacterium]